MHCMLDQRDFALGEKKPHLQGERHGLAELERRGKSADLLLVAKFCLEEE